MKMIRPMTRLQEGSAIPGFTGNSRSRKVLLDARTGGLTVPVALVATGAAVGCPLPDWTGRWRGSGERSAVCVATGRKSADRRMNGRGKVGMVTPDLQGYVVMAGTADWAVLTSAPACFFCRRDMRWARSAAKWRLAPCCPRASAVISAAAA